ncbi:hypothetical protein BCR34DRAFT_127767 [Clohesyomyces aquaticus]|uniref:Uncharacterized protein n=1 Tax=Clohesyomyces aquaticus TaxID=1231657 RepID=A0A1Y2AA57_9PLEO|nr:hypothetical protein BCR34DRAFT_127767 [Clohesyomyces aquaticus]
MLCQRCSGARQIVLEFSRKLSAAATDGNEQTDGWARRGGITTSLPRRFHVHRPNRFSEPSISRTDPCPDLESASFSQSLRALSSPLPRRIPGCADNPAIPRSQAESARMERGIRP